MPQFKGKSAEELRFEDYKAGKKNGGLISVVLFGWGARADTAVWFVG